MAIIPLSNTEVFPSYDMKAAGNVVLTKPSIIIAIEDLPSASEDELAKVDGNAGEFIRAVVKQGKTAIDNRAVAERPTKFNILQQLGVTSVGLNPLTGLVEGSLEYQVVTVYPVGANDAEIAPEPTD